MDAPRELILMGPEALAVQTLSEALQRTLTERGIAPQWRLLTDPRAALLSGRLAGLAPLCLLLAAEPGDPASLVRETALRKDLQAVQWPYRVLHRTSTALLDAALLAMGLAATHPQENQRRREAQFDLDRGRVPWRCERCSDADCEHSLFTRLTRGAGPQ